MNNRNNSSFTYRSYGSNSQGNRYSGRNYGPAAPNQNAFHYSNADRSFFYSNANGSKYFEDRHGNVTYTAPNGVRFTRDGSAWVREQQ